MKRPGNILLLYLFLLLTACQSKPGPLEPAAFVDPFIGTGGHGHTYPGATVPFGMVQLSPDTRLGGWDGAMEVAIKSILPFTRIYYTLDGTTPDRQSSPYLHPISLEKTTTLKAIGYHEEFGYSFPVKAGFVKMDLDKSVQLVHPYHPNYHGGGPEALIDGLRGSANWRLGAGGKAFIFVDEIVIE